MFRNSLSLTAFVTTCVLALNACAVGCSGGGSGGWGGSAPAPKAPPVETCEAVAIDPTTTPKGRQQVRDARTFGGQVPLDSGNITLLRSAHGEMHLVIHDSSVEVTQLEKRLGSDGSEWVVATGVYLSEAYANCEGTFSPVSFGLKGTIRDVVLTKDQVWVASFDKQVTFTAAKEGGEVVITFPVVPKTVTVEPPKPPAAEVPPDPVPTPPADGGDEIPVEPVEPPLAIPVEPAE